MAPNLARGIAEFKRTQRATTTASGDAPPDESEAHGEPEFVAGRDYELDRSGLDALLADAAQSESALS